MVAARSNRKDHDNAIIGEFTTNGNTILGHVRTLTVSMKARLNPVSYTHLDVYKRQPFDRPVENPGQTLDRKAAAVQLSAFE